MKNHIEEILKGTVEQFTANKHDDVDGLTVNNESVAVTLKFPPHTAKQVMAIVNIGDSAALTWHSAKDDRKEKDKKSHHAKNELLTIKNTVTNLSIAVKEIPAPKPADAGELVEFDLENPEFIKGKEQEIIGLKTNDKYIHLKPHKLAGFQNELLKAPQIKVKAKKRLENAGFVNVKNLQVYHGIAIEINTVAELTWH